MGPQRKSAYKLQQKKEHERGWEGVAREAGGKPGEWVLQNPKEEKISRNMEY